MIVIFLKVEGRRKKKNSFDESTQCSIKDERSDSIESERYTTIPTCRATVHDQNEILIIPMSNGQDLSSTFEFESNDTGDAEQALKLRQNSISLHSDETEVNLQIEDPLSDVLNDSNIDEDERKSLKEMFAEESVLSIFESVTPKEEILTPVFSTV